MCPQFLQSDPKHLSPVINRMMVRKNRPKTLSAISRRHGLYAAGRILTVLLVGVLSSALPQSSAPLPEGESLMQGTRSFA